MWVGNSLINRVAFLRSMMIVSQQHRSMLIQHALCTWNQGEEEKENGS